MRAVDIIVKKRDRGELTHAEINYFIQGFTQGEIPDYQAAAWAMAVLLNGMTMREITDLTLAMANSGEVLDLAGIAPILVDKHSTGGVGDKTTLVVLPIVAACGLTIGKMSGHGLGFSGGTLDKMESIPGFRTDLSIAEFIEQLQETGMVLTGQTGDLAPADGKLYALRDVTGTVQSIPLIASSIICKKIAGGAQAILLDVKVGNGAFMETEPEARLLAETMVKIVRAVGRNAVALISDMNQPLGYAIGNALELGEAIDTLHGGGVKDFREHCLTLAAHLLKLGKVTDDEQEAIYLAEAAVKDGRAWQRFRALVEAQGGDVSYVDDPERLPRAKYIETIPSPNTGYLKEINARSYGTTAVYLGAGRSKKEDKIDHAVGIIVHHKVGDWIEAGQALFTIHANDARQLKIARQKLLAAHTWSSARVEPLPHYYGIIRS